MWKFILKLKKKIKKMKLIKRSIKILLYIYILNKHFRTKLTQYEIIKGSADFFLLKLAQLNYKIK